MRGAAHVSHRHDERRLQQAACFQVADQRRENLIELRQVEISQHLEIVFVCVPMRAAGGLGGDGDERHACLD